MPATPWGWKILSVYPAMPSQWLTVPFELFQSIHVHIAFHAPLRPGDVPQSSRRQHQGTVAVREGPDHPRPSANLVIDRLQRIIRNNISN